MTDDYFTIASEAPTATAGAMITCVRLTGEFDLGARDALRDALLGIVAANDSTHIVLDLDHVRFIDSEGLSAILDGYTAAERAGVVLRLASAHGSVYRVLDIVGLLHLLAPAAERPIDPADPSRPSNVAAN